MRRSFSILALLSVLVFGSGCGMLRIQPRPLTGIEQEEDYGPILKEIRVEGLGYTKEFVVLRQLASEVGKPYTEEIARQNYRNLDRLKIFSSVHFEFEPESEGGILIIHVTEVNPYTPSLKVGITDENGVSVGFGGSSANLLGLAFKANASANTGGQSGVKLGLANPWRPGNVLEYNIQFSWQIRDNNLDNFREDAIELNSFGLKNIGKRWRLGGFFDFFSIGSDTTGVTLNPNNRDNVPRLGVIGAYDSRDFPRNPTSGWFVIADIGKSGGFLGGPADYWRSNLDLRAFWTPRRRHTFAFFSFSTTTTGTVDVDIPVWDDFHIGGTNTVRGWTFDARKGKNQAIGTLEYRFLALEAQLVQLAFLKMDMGIQLAAFWDAGTAWSTETRPDDNFITGAGVGIRLLMPAIDMLRFDFGVGEPSVSVTVHIGSNSKAMAQRRRVR
ncbi:MAG: BamA/TamA family outer membrane protein [Rhodothermia bacterium]